MASFWADFFWSLSITVFLFTILAIFLATLWWYYTKSDNSTSKKEELTTVKESFPTDLSSCKVLELDILEDIREVLLSENGNSKPVALHDKALLKVKHKLWEKEYSDLLESFLRQMITNKEAVEGVLLETMKPLIEHLKRKCGESIDCAEVMSIHTLNVLYAVAHGMCFNFDDERLIGIKKELENILKLWPNFSIDCQQSPESEPLDLKNAKGEFLTRMKQILIRHEEVNDLKQKTLTAHLLDHEGPELTQDDITEYLLMVFLCGYPTLAKFFSSAAVLLAENFEVQEKISTILNDISNVESMDEPYVEATLQEILRCVKAVPVAIRLCHSERSDDKNETATRDTLTRMHLDAILDGGKYWECPETFNPSRFLDDKGAIIQKDAYLPFSIGSRSCPGMVLAEVAGYIFLVTVLKDLVFSKPNQPEDADEKAKDILPVVVRVSARKESTMKEK